MITLSLVQVQANWVWHVQDNADCGWSSRDPVASVEVRAGSKIAATLIAESVTTDGLCKTCFRYRSRVTPAVAKEVADYTGAKMPGMFFVLQSDPTAAEILALVPMLDLTEDEVWAKYLQWRAVSPGVKQILRGK